MIVNSTSWIYLTGVRKVECPDYRFLLFAQPPQIHKYLEHWVLMMRRLTCLPLPFLSWGDSNHSPEFDQHLLPWLILIRWNSVWNLLMNAHNPCRTEPNQIRAEKGKEVHWERRSLCLSKRKTWNGWWFRSPIQEVGFLPRKRENLWTLFTTKRGTGLGLSIVHKMIEHHNGSSKSKAKWAEAQPLWSSCLGLNPLHDSWRGRKRMLKDKI